MKLSISNIGWDIAHDQQMYEEMQKRGFSGLEIAPTRIFASPAYEKINDAGVFAGELKSKFNLEISSMQSIWFGRTENIFSTELEREALIKYTMSAIDFAKAVECKNLVFGCPKNRNMAECKNESTAIEFFDAIGKYAHKNECAIALEANPPIYNTNFMNTTQQAIDMAKRCCVGISVNVDFGTIIENGESLESVRNNIELISHIHISEPFLEPIKNRQQHLELSNILRETDYSGYVSIEMKCQPLETVFDIMSYVSGVFS